MEQGKKMRYVLFVKEECPYCVKAVELLEEKNLSFKKVVFDADQENVLTEVKDAYDWKTVPMIFYKNGNLVKFIGGYTDLVGLLDDE